jgi:coenzyme F420-reducing hydrogenase beta subunit
MRENSEGFKMPFVDSELCSNCEACKKTCPYLSPPSGLPVDLNLKNAYTLFASNEEAVKRSASGGVFYGLALETLRLGGYVCGCVWFGEKLAARHIVSNDIRDIERMQGSKYVQSDIGECFGEIRELLNKRLYVLFSGTPCQVAGILNFMPAELHERLITLSIVCHGVPSPVVWHTYITELSERVGSRLETVNMRSKVYSYHNPMCEYRFEDDRVIYKAAYLEDMFTFGFVDNLYLRMSCHDCKFKGKNTFGDIICGDLHDSVKAPNGASAVFALTEKGDKFLDSAFKEALIKANAELMARDNGMLNKSTPFNVKRLSFMRCLKEGRKFADAFSSCVSKRYYVKVILYKLHIFHFLRNAKKGMFKTS